MKNCRYQQAEDFFVFLFCLGVLWQRGLEIRPGLFMRIKDNFFLLDVYQLRIHFYPLKLINDLFFPVSNK